VGYCSTSDAKAGIIKGKTILFLPLWPVFAAHLNSPCKVPLTKRATSQNDTVGGGPLPN